MSYEMRTQKTNWFSGMHRDPLISFAFPFKSRFISMCSLAFTISASFTSMFYTSSQCISITWVSRSSLNFNDTHTFCSLLFLLHRLCDFL